MNRYAILIECDEMALPLTVPPSGTDEAGGAEGLIMKKSAGFK